MTNETPPRPEPVQPQQEWIAEVFRDLSGPEESTDQTDADEESAPVAAPDEQLTFEAPPGPAPVQPRSRSGRITLDGLPVGRRRPNGQSWPHRLLGGLRSVLSSSRLDADLVASIDAVQRPVTTGRRIAVAGVRDGSGTTTVAALLAAVLADRRADGVLAVDTDAALRSLLWRFGIEDPAPDAVTPTDPADSADADAFAPERARGLWLMPGGPEYGDISGVGEYARFFGVTVVDLGPAYLSTADVGAQAGVLVVPATLDGLRAVRAAAADLTDDLDDVVAHPVVALVQLTPGSDGIDLDQALILLNRYGLAAVTLPYDRHLAAGGPILPDLIAETTVAAATALAARVLGLAQPDLTASGPTA